MKTTATMTFAGRNISVHTVETHLTAPADSFVLYKVGRYDIKGKQYLGIDAKYYLPDIGRHFFEWSCKSVLFIAGL